MSKIILCSGPRKSGKTLLYKQILASFKKASFEYYRVNIFEKEEEYEKSKNKKDAMGSIIEGTLEEVGDEMNEICKNNWFFRDDEGHSRKMFIDWIEAEYDFSFDIMPNLRIFMITRNSDLWKWYEKNPQYQYDEKIEKIPFFLKSYVRYQNEKHSSFEQDFQKFLDEKEGKVTLCNGTEVLFDEDEEPADVLSWKYMLENDYFFCCDPQDEELLNAIEIFSFFEKFEHYYIGKPEMNKRAEIRIKKNLQKILPFSENLLMNKKSIQVIKRKIDNLR